MADRKQLSKRTRFEVFKRDGFRCAYCGRTPPDVLLHVDHIVAVANGGGNDAANLVTACADCNLGKSSVPLTAVAASLEKQADDARERAEQVRAYNALLADLRTEAERDATEVWEAFSSSLPWPEDFQGTGVVARDDDLRSIRYFLTRLPKAELLNAVEIAAAAEARGRVKTTFTRLEDSQVKIGCDERFRYFCGIVWRMIRQREGHV